MVAVQMTSSEPGAAMTAVLVMYRGTSFCLSQSDRMDRKVCSVSMTMSDAYRHFRIQRPERPCEHRCHPGLGRTRAGGRCPPSKRLSWHPSPPQLSLSHTSITAAHTLCPATDRRRGRKVRRTPGRWRIPPMGVRTAPALDARNVCTPTRFLAPCHSPRAPWTSRLRTRDSFSVFVFQTP